MTSETFRNSSDIIYAVGIPKNRLDETVLLSTHSIYLTERLSNKPKFYEPSIGLTIILKYVVLLSEVITIKT